MMHNLRRDDLRRDEEMREDEISTADIATERARKPQLVDDRRSVVQDSREPVEARDVGSSQVASEERAAMFPENEVTNLRSRWDSIQTGFVDEPRKAVEQADSLVAQAIKRIAEQFSEERSRLEQQWDRGDNVSTEDLRQALRRYRSFFDRLLSM